MSRQVTGPGTAGPTGPAGADGAAGPTLGGSLTTGNIVVGVAGVSAASPGLLKVIGSDGSASPATSYIGEELSNVSSATCNTSTYSNCAIKTLTVGVWIVGGSFNNTAGTGAATGLEGKLYVKNANTSVAGFDYCYISGVAANQGCGFTFPPRVVVIATGDANKQIIMKARSVGATNDINGYVYAIRVA